MSELSEMSEGKKETEVNNGTGEIISLRLDFFGYIRYDGGMELFDDFLDVLKAFQKEKLEYILIGGFAVIIHGMPRVTQDLDIFVKMVPENIEKLRRALKTIFDDNAIFPWSTYGTEEKE